MNASWAIIIPLLPWLACLWIVLGILFWGNQGEAGERGTARVALVATGLATLAMLGLDALALLHGPPGQLQLVPWLESGPYQVWISLTLDQPALVMATLVTLSAFLTLRFAVNYLHREQGFQRFFAVLCLFSGGMSLLALAGNAVLAFIGWEAAGLSSYLLIAYSFDRTTASSNATRAFLTNRFGDAGFFLSIALTFIMTGGVEWSTLFSSTNLHSRLLAGAVAIGFLVAALAKSAQIPFAAWISQALEGPTPSSAIFYGALMAHAGAFLIIRLEPLLRHSPFIMGILLCAGLLTALFGLLVGRVQTDVKSALIFSTQTQLGLIFIECGAGYFTFALWHMAGHSLWRIYQFLHAPSYMHQSEPPARHAPGRPRYKLYDLALHRFWLDSLADALITRPTQALAQDVQHFDETVVSRMTGRPLSEDHLATQGEWEEKRLGFRSSENLGVAHGRGVLGRLLERTAKVFNWFEEHLVLSSGGDGLLRALNFLGGYVTRVDHLLGQTRYLILLIVLTFVVIL